ncbi:hypothetical protein CMV_022437 [Castanea mollissima]|uniref:Aminotransferase-like plant mobile domain-containing protein n=1 Tax=Castanea mollissima TaxID=60419 RepID=A0A8J4QWF3_9ROSI|nr:hypothetical protein CMV_022437 [Castanea mollissima]
MVYWLSRNMLIESPFDHIKAYLFPLVVLLARGKSLAVGAMCLSNLYNHLDALHIFKMEGSPYYAVVTHLNLALLQVWAWERCLPLVTHACSVTTVRKCYPPNSKNNHLDFLQKFCESPPKLLKWIGVKSPSLSWVELMDKEADYILRPYVGIVDGFSLTLLDEDVEFDVSAYSSLLARTPLWLFLCGPSGSWAWRFGLNKAPLPTLLLENSRVGVLTWRACQYWNEIAVRFSDYVAVGRDECTFPPPPSVAYAEEVPEPWEKYEPMAKARISAPLACGEALNAKPLAKRERPKTFVDAFALPPPLPKKVCSSVAAGLRALPHTVLALHAVKDDVLAPLNCVVTMCPLLGPEASDNQVPSSPVASEGKVDIPESFEDDLSDDCENVAVPIATASPFITIEQKSSVGTDNEMLGESYDGTNESLAGITGTLDVSKGVDAGGEAANMKLVQVTLGMGVEAPVDATIVPDSQIEAHVHMPSTRIHQFSVPSESVPLLEHLQTKHNDFIKQLIVGSVVKNPLLRILAAMLMDMQETQMNALTEEWLFEWRDAVRYLHKAGLEVSFVLYHLQNVSTSWFHRDVKTRLASIVRQISELEKELAILKSEMVQLQRNSPNTVILDNTAIHGLL